MDLSADRNYAPLGDRFLVTEKESDPRQDRSLDQKLR